MEIVLIFIGIVLILNRSSKYDPFSKDMSICIRPILFLCIFIRHLLAYVNDFYMLNDIFMGKGFWFVGVFFLISGYGLTYQLENCRGGVKEYLKAFLFKRNVKVLIPLIAIFPIFLLGKYLLNGDVFSFSLLNIVKRFWYTLFIVDYSWYVYEIIFFYCVFWFSVRFFGAIWKQMIMLCIVVVLLLTSFIGVNVAWYCSGSCFILGILMATYKNKVSEILCQHKYVVGGMCVLTLKFGMDMLNSFDSIHPFSLVNIRYMLIANIVAIAFCVVCLLLMTKINICNKLTRYLGSISYEMYLTQGLAILFLHNKYINFSGFAISFILGLLMCVTISILLHKISKSISDWMITKC